MSTAERKTCRSCGADVVWLKHVRTGKPAPIDAVPGSSAGNIVIHLDRGTYENVQADEREAQREWLHTNHFSTCPQSADWKKRGSIRDVEVRR